MVHVSSNMTPPVVTPSSREKRRNKGQSKKKNWGETCRLLGKKPAVEATLKFTSDCKAGSFRARRRVVAHWYGTGTYRVE